MARTIVAIYDSFYAASKAVRELELNGLPRNMIDIFIRPNQTKAGHAMMSVKRKAVRPEIYMDGQGTGAQIGAGIGSAVGIVGGILTLLGALHIPGLAPNIVPAALSLLAITGVSAITGGVFGGLLGLGITEEEARQYSKNIRAGDVLVTVLADWDSVEPVIEVLNKHNPLEVQEKSPGRPKTVRAGLASAKQPAYLDTREHQDR